jgi:hypothetical protein
MKPKSILLYNKTMGGVDLSDAKLYQYLSERKTLKWTTKVVLSLIGRSLLNAYIVYQANTIAAKPLTRHKFLVSVVEGLTSCYRPSSVPRKRRSHTELQACREAGAAPAVVATPQNNPWSILQGHDLVKLEGKKLKNCVAHPGGKRKRTKYQCAACRVGLCPECYCRYHLRPIHF